MNRLSEAKPQALVAESAEERVGRVERRVWGVCLVLVFLFWSGAAVAGQLAERLARFPNWENKPLVQVAKGDLVYPGWMAGSWNVTSTLVDLVAPLAPDIVTPGFEGNRRYLDRSIGFQVRFGEEMPRQVQMQAGVVADRAFNGLSLARAYLGERAVVAVKVDPNSPNRQITLLSGDRQLVSVVTGRASERPDETRFVTTEVFQQLFRGGSRPHFNQVETTTAYQQLPTSNPAVEADQVTAVYLSPQDPNYFVAGSRPAALYRYKLEFFPVSVEPSQHSVGVSDR